MIMNTYVHFFLKMMHSLCIVEFWSSKIWANHLIGFLKNWRIHVEFHCKFVTMTKYVLTNEIINLGVKSLSLKP